MKSKQGGDVGWVRMTPVSLNSNVFLVPPDLAISLIKLFAIVMAVAPKPAGQKGSL